jgi:hypothetical protein
VASDLKYKNCWKNSWFIGYQFFGLTPEIHKAEMGNLNFKNVGNMPIIIKYFAYLISADCPMQLILFQSLLLASSKH